MSKTIASKLAVLVVFFLHCVLITHAQNRTVTGTILDATGAGIPGVTVTVKGTNRAVQTNTAGQYTIEAPANATLEFSATGYALRSVPVEGISSSLTLETSTTDLNEVVVVGYGTARRRDLTGSVSSVQAKDFNKGVQTAPDQLIQGKVAGVQIINNSGMPGGGTTVRIRGAASIRSGNQPLFVVDGVQLDNRSARPGGSVGTLGTTPGSNPLNFINPNDIASIDVLKDASATAIYGSRGANGVVVITTKKGQTGAPKVDFAASYGIANILKRLEVLNGDEYRAALKQYGLPNTGDKGGNVDALDAITRTAKNQNYSIGVGAGTENARYRLSLGYLDQEGIIRKSDFKKLSVGLSSNFRFLESKKLGLDVNLITSQINENIVPVTENAGFEGSLVGQALQWNPTNPLRRPDGSLNVDKGGNQINPLAYSEAYNDKSKLTTILASVSPSYKLTKELEYRFLYSVNYSTGTRKGEVASFINVQGIQEDTATKTLGGAAGIFSNELYNTQLTHTLNYVKQLTANINLNAVAGFEYSKYENRGNGISATKFQNTRPYYDFINFTQTADRNAFTFIDPTIELQSYFARAILNIQDKYLFQATFRADGSSKFGANNKYGYFPSVSAAWNVSKEAFMEGVTAINSLKLRASYGKTGNQEFPAGAAQERYVVNQGRIDLAQFKNEDLKWETTTTFNVGADFGIFRDRLYGSLDYYNKSTTDLLFARDAADPLPPNSGRRFENLQGEVINSGLEVALNSSLIRQSKLNWDFGVNATFQKNKVQDFPGFVRTGAINGQGLSNVTIQRIQNGLPLNAFFGKRFLGIDKATGLANYEDEGNTEYYLGDPNPNVLLGINTRIGYDKVSLEVSLNGALGQQVYNNTSNAALPINNLGARNIDRNLLGTDPQESLANPLSASSRYLENGDYLKLANATLSYRIGDFGKSFRNAVVYVTGQNLFIITKYSGFDPEVNTNKAINDIPSFGIEYTPYPTARTFSFGINLSF